MKLYAIDNLEIQLSELTVLEKAPYGAISGLEISTANYEKAITILTEENIWKQTDDY